MSKKLKNNSTDKHSASRDAVGTTARAGILALLLAPLAYLLGGFTRENAFEWLKALGFALTLALLVRWPLWEPFKIPSASMKPTFHGDPRFLRGDRVFVNKFVYGVRFPFNGIKPWFMERPLWYAKRRLWYGAKPKRFEIVVFKSVEDTPKHTTLVKRIIGLPGERVHIAGGRVYVNGKPIELPPEMPAVEYTSNIGRYGILESDEYALVPENCYLLLGDNSAGSRDGRVFGWVPNEHLLGRVFCIWWPPSRWRDFTGFSDTLWWRSTLVALGLLFFARLFLGRSWRVCTDGLNQAVAPGEHVYIDRCVLGPPLPFTRRRLFHARAPRRGEIVLYRPPASADGAAGLLLGRIAGKPGERVSFDDGKLEVDGKPPGEPFLAGHTFTISDPQFRYGRSKRKEYSLVPDDHYFILTDNAEGAPDSRTFGWVARKDLVGVASAVWWPITRWRRLRTG